MVPLQMGIPGGPELLIVFLLVFLIVGVLLVLIPAFLVYRDAKNQGMDYALAWGLGVGALFLAGVLPGVLAVIAYLVVRSEKD